MTRGALTPRRAYRLIVSQVEGERPVGSIECSRCSYLDWAAVAIPVDADAEQLGAALLAAVKVWAEHPCGGVVASDISEPYPQDEPAGQPERNVRNGNG